MENLVFILLILCVGTISEMYKLVEIERLEDESSAAIGPKYNVEHKDWVELLGPGNYSILEGNELALICQGSENLRLGWSKNGDMMPNGETYILGEHIIIQSVSRKDAGTYRCQDLQNMNLFTEKVVRVLYGPDVSIGKLYIHSQGSVHLNLVCQVESEPAVEIAWYKDGTLLSSTSQGSVLMYNIIHPSIVHFGKYTCTANNSATVYKTLHITGLDNKTDSVSSGIFDNFDVLSLYFAIVIHALSNAVWRRSISV